MCWDKAAIREDRQQAYFDSILMIVSESGGEVTRQQLIEQVSADLPHMGNTALHVDRMVRAMVEGRCLVWDGEKLRLNSRPGDQQNR